MCFLILSKPIFTDGVSDLLWIEMSGFGTARRKVELALIETPELRDKADRIYYYNNGGVPPRPPFGIDGIGDISMIF